MKKDKMKDICEAFIKTTAELYDIPGICIGASIEDTRYITAAGYADINEKRTMRGGRCFSMRIPGEAFHIGRHNETGEEREAEP